MAIAVYNVRLNTHMNMLPLFVVLLS